MFSLRLFLLNHSSALAWRDLPPEWRAGFSPNVLLREAEWFIADAAERRFRFELTEQGSAESGPVRHRADMVVLQSWGLLTLVRLGGGGAGPTRFTALRDSVIISAAYVTRRRKT